MAFFIISSSTSLNAPRTFQKSFYDFIELMFENKIEVLKGFGFIDSETDHYKTPQQMFERGRVVFLLRGEFNDIKKMTTKINDLIDLINRFKELDKKELDRLTKDLNNFVNPQIKKPNVHKSAYQLYVSQLSNLNNFCIFKKNLNEILNDCYEVNEVNYADLFFDPGPFAVSEMLSFKKYPEANKLFIYHMISMYEIESYSGITYDNRPILDYNLISHSPSMKNLRNHSTRL